MHFRLRRRRVRSRPRSVTWAFWLWWPQIISQAMTVIGAVIASVGALVVGGPALDVVLFSALPSSGTVISAQEGPEAAYGQLALSAVLATAMLTATVLTFTPSARAFFGLRGPDDTQTGPSADGDTRDEGEATAGLAVPNAPECMTRWADVALAALAAKCIRSAEPAISPSTTPTGGGATDGA